MEVREEMEISQTATYNSYKRLIWIDVSKFLAIYFLLWGHCIQHLSGPNFYNNPVFLFIYSFHTLFMMLSGFFASKLVNRNFKEVLVSKFMHLLLSTIVFGVLLWLQSHFLLHQTEKSFIHILYYSFWFLKSVLACTILFYVGIKVCKRKWMGILIMIVVSQILDIIPHLKFLQLTYMFPSFVLGYVLYCYKDYFYRYVNIAACVCSVCFVLLFSKFTKELLYPNLHIDGMLRMGWEFVYVMYYKLLIGIIGSLGVMSVIFIVCRKLNGSKILYCLANYGRYTLVIYILQTFLLESLLKHFFSYPTTPYSWLFSLVYAPFISAIVLFLCLEIYRWFDKIKLDWLFDFSRCPFRLWK